MDGASGQLWQGGGDVFLRNAAGSLGASIGHMDVHALGVTQAITSYGAFAEWYAARSVTLQVKGGGFNGAISGVYGGAGATAYLPRHFALDLTYDYVRIDTAGHTSAVGGGISYFWSPRYPAALDVQYSHDTGSGGGDAVMISLSYRFGGVEDGLAAWDRHGPTRWNGGLPL